MSKNVVHSNETIFIASIQSVRKGKKKGAKGIHKASIDARVISQERDNQEITHIRRSK